MTRFLHFKRALALALLCLLTSGLAHAEFLGLPNGRSANPGNLSGLSVELGFVTGDLGGADYQNIGGRINYRVNPELVLFGDFGISEFGNSDGNPLGLGLFYFLSRQRMLASADMAFKASYHTGSYDVIGQSDVDIDGLSLEVLFSGLEAITPGGLNWYANVGFHRLSVGSASDSELGVGGGLVLPVGPGEVYGGVDFIDETTFGLGYRYLLR